MARKAKAKPSRKTGVKTAKPKFVESELKPGELRKLNALRNSVGKKIGEKAFDEWLKTQGTEKDNTPEDKDAALIAETLVKLIDDGKLRIPRGGYLVTRGRGRVVVTRAKNG